MIIYTVQLSRRRWIEPFDTTLIDTTVKSGLSAFAPSWGIVLDHKRKAISDREYINEFHAMMRRSVIQHIDTWTETANLPSVALGCYCPANCFCHRLLLVYYFQVFCTRRKIPFQYLGEITHDGTKPVVTMPPLPFKTL